MEYYGRQISHSARRGATADGLATHGTDFREKRGGGDAVTEGTLSMITREECRKNAEECLHWASGAKTEEERRSFLDMARTWTEAASMANGGSLNDIPKHLPNFKPAQRPAR